MSAPDLAQKVHDYYALAERASAGGVLPFLNFLVIDASPRPRPYREAAEPWQWALAKRAAPLFEHVAGDNNKEDKYTGPLNLWYGLPKGHDKSSLIARLVNRTLAFSKRAWTGYVYAEDRDQAGLLLEAMSKESNLNPWLQKHLKFKNWTVTGANGSRIEIEAADAASSQGTRPDLVICDELTHWTSDELFKSVMSGKSKRLGCACIVITNAGIRHTWQWETRELARTSPRWMFYEAPHRLATWMDEGQVNEDRKLLPPSEAARLFDNLWVDPGLACGLVTRAEAEACEALGREMSLVPTQEGRTGREYVGAIDYGAVKDRCVLTVLHMEADIAVVDQMDVWQGSREHPVQIAAVEQWIEEARKKYSFAALVIDPHQMEGTIQKYSAYVPIVKWEARAGRANFDMAQNLRAMIVNKKLVWYPGCGDIQTPKGKHTLVDELTELITRAMGYGWRLDHLPGKFDDRAVALAMACMQMVKQPLRKPIYVSNFFF